MVSKGRGRPTKAPKRGETRVSLGLRVTAEVKRRLDAAAKKTGRSQSQEAEFRLERSFEHDDIFGGPEMRAIAMAMFAAFGHGALLSGKPREIWATDRDSYSAGAQGVFERLIDWLPNASDEEKAEFAKVSFQIQQGRLVGKIVNRQKTEGSK